MTLDLSKFISNSIQSQAKIQHFDMSSKTVKRDEIPTSVASLIKKQYGDTYLQDANYVSFFWGQFDNDFSKKLFNVVNQALGKSANRLTDVDFKKLILDSSDSNEEQDDGNEEEEIEDIEISSDETDDEDQQSMQDDIDDVLAEDDDSLEKAKSKTYLFLKITIR